MQRLLIVFLGILCYALNANNIFDEAKLLNDNVKMKLEQMSSELYDKTGVQAYLLTHTNPNNLTLQELSKQYIDYNKTPYAVLVLVPKRADQKAGKVDLFLSNSNLCDKNKILSPLPNTGSILPILVANKAEDIYNAALLNGFADICESIASNKNIELQTALGNQNRNTVNILRYAIYGILLFAVIVLIFRRFNIKRT